MFRVFVGATAVCGQLNIGNAVITAGDDGDQSLYEGAPPTARTTVTIALRTAELTVSRNSQLTEQASGPDASPVTGSAPTCGSVS